MLKYANKFHLLNQCEWKYLIPQLLIPMHILNQQHFARARKRLRSYFGFVRHVQQSCWAAPVPVRACIQWLFSSNLHSGVIRSCGAAPFSSDSMLTTLQKAPKKRLGLAVSFPISHRPARSWTQLMANNYQGCFSMTAPGGLIAAIGSGRPAVKQDASLLPLVLIFPPLISC